MFSIICIGDRPRYLANPDGPHFWFEFDFNLVYQFDNKEIAKKVLFRVNQASTISGVRAEYVIIEYEKLLLFHIMTN